MSDEQPDDEQPDEALGPQPDTTGLTPWETINGPAPDPAIVREATRAAMADQQPAETPEADRVRYVTEVEVYATNDEGDVFWGGPPGGIEDLSSEAAETPGL